MITRALSAGIVAILIVTPATSLQRATPTEYEASIRRTSYGIPHIAAATLASLGFGEGYAQAEDHLCGIAEQIVEERGELAKYFGRGDADAHLNSDIVVKALRIRERAAELQASQPQEIRDWNAGFAAGYNKYLSEKGKNAIAGWCRGQDWVSPIDALDVAAMQRLRILRGSGLPPAAAIANVQPPSAGAAKPPVAELELAGDEVLAGSNGWALGRARTENGRGMLFANPHYPWTGPNRFWEKHLTIPGRLDVYGVSPIGVPGVIIGFNDAVGWTHTIASGTNATAYVMDLVPGVSTRYRYGAVERSMTSVAVSVEVRGLPDPVERTIWFTHYGPLIAPPGLSWTTSRAFSIRIGEEVDGGSLAQWLAMGRARSMAELRMAHATHQAIPHANTIATSADGIAWYTDGSGRPHLSEAAIAKWLDRRANDTLTGELYRNAAIVLLDGSDPSFEWQDDREARRRGMIPYRLLPQLQRDDYVFNANDGFWFAHERARIEGKYSPLLGGPRLSTRTRNNVLHLSNAEPYTAAGDDGKFNLAELQAAVLSNRSLTADLLVPELVARCKAAPSVTIASRAVDLTKACDALGAWDRRFDLDSRGSVLFREWLGLYNPVDLYDRGRLFAVAFDPGDPVRTPRGLADGGLALENLAKAIGVLESRNLPIDASLVNLQYAPSKLPKRIAVHGGTSNEGVLNVTGRGAIQTLEPVAMPRPVSGSRLLTAEGYPIAGGSSFIMALEYTDDGPRAMAILTYSQSGNPDSEHFADQTALFSQKRWRPVLFKRNAIAADTKREYKVTGSAR
jgi:acyl-homoserine-lactone acylase